MGANSEIEADELANLSDEEREALEGESTAADADGGDDGAGGGGKEGGDDEAAKAAADAAAAAAKAAAGDGGDGAAADGAAAGEDDADVALPFSPRMSAPDVSKYDEDRAALLDARKELRAKHRAGEIPTDEYDDQSDDINDRLAALDREKDRADLALQHNADLAQQEYLQTIARVKADIKRDEGIDYDADPVLLRQWDAHVKALAKDEANADKPYSWFLREGHRQVVAAAEKVAAGLGFVKKEADGGKPNGKDALRAAADARKPAVGKVPSLATIPAAASETASGDEFAHIDSLEGEEYELAIAKLTPEQQERYSRQ